MKSSYKITIALAIALILSLGTIYVYQYVNRVDNSQNVNTETNKENTSVPDDNVDIVPFTSIVKFDNKLYTTRSNSKTKNIVDANVIQIDAACFAILDGDVYYITEGDDEFAPELRRCDIDGNNDKSITEFVSPYGSPAIIDGYIYCAYYGSDPDDANTAIYRIKIGEDDETAEKIIGGEYFIYGYDAEYIYYNMNNAASNSSTTLRRMKYDGSDSSEILNYNTRTDSIIIDKKYVFFSAYDNISHSFKIYRSPKSGNGNIDAYTFECMSDKFDIIDNRLYYQASSAIYSCELNGNDEIKVADISNNSLYAYDFLKFDNILYFRERNEDTNLNDTKDSYFRLDLESGEKKNITR